jgi:DinB superfamily
MSDLAARVDLVLAGFAEAHGRLVARLEGATDDEAVRPPSGGGWTPAQIGAHVAAFDSLLARMVSGELPYARPAPPGFVECPWPEIQSTLLGPLTAPPRLVTPVDTTRPATLKALKVGGADVIRAFRSLTPERAVLTVTHAPVGTLTLLQVGGWIVAHTIRHNAQMKRALGR